MKWNTGVLKKNNRAEKPGGVNRGEGKNLYRDRKPILAHPKRAVHILFSLFIFSTCHPPTLGPSMKSYGVVFRLQELQANTICIVGDFNYWESGKNCLHYLPNEGIWQIILPLKEGTYQYMFIIDHTKWIADPEAQAYIDDGFGNKNSLLVYR
jgi:hypothetical protein